MRLGTLASPAAWRLNLFALVSVQLAARVDGERDAARLREAHDAFRDALQALDHLGVRVAEAVGGAGADDRDFGLGLGEQLGARRGARAVVADLEHVRT